jgi:hypothetical protein
VECQGLLAVLLAAGLPIPGLVPPVPELSVQWFDTGRELQAIRGPVKARVAEILETASVRVRWTASGQDVDPDAIAVILASDPPPVARAMGMVALGRSQRFVYVYSNAVLKGAGLGGPVRSLGPDEAVIFSRALSRVIAHEIVHSLIGRDHMESGIMSETLTPVMLQKARLELDDVTKRRLREALGSKPWCPETR